MGTLNDAMHVYYSNSVPNLMKEGVLFVQDHIEVAVPASGVHRFAVTVGAAPVTLRSFSVNTLSVDTIIEIFEGGTYTGGTPEPYVRLNRASSNTDLPFTDSSDDVTISAAGTSVRKHQMWSAQNAQAAFNEEDVLILAANTVYYFEVTNGDPSAEDYDFTIIMAIKQ